MSEDFLSVKARMAIRHIRNWIMHYGKAPSVRELMKEMKYKSSRSALLLMEELIENGFLEKKEDGSIKLIKDLESENVVRTVSVPLVGSVACGTPLLAEENIEAMVPVSISIAKPGYKYFLLKAIGDSMDLAGINDGDLILIRQQATADNGQNVVALIDDEATVKEFHHMGNLITLIPRSTNTEHQQIIVNADMRIQGVVLSVIPKVKNKSK